MTDVKPIVKVTIRMPQNKEHILDIIAKIIGYSKEDMLGVALDLLLDIAGINEKTMTVEDIRNALTSFFNLSPI